MMSQKTDTMIKLALVFTISLLSFSIGTYVGKMYSDNQHKLAQLEPHAAPATDHQEFASAHGGADTAAIAADATTDHAVNTANSTRETTLTDSEVAKIAEEFATEDTEISDEKVIPTVSANAEKVIKSIPATVRKPAAKAPVAAQPVMSAKAMTAPAVENLKRMDAEQRNLASIPQQKDVTPMHFTVQVGSFPTEVEAQKMTKELLSKGFKTSLVPAQVNGQTWFRVNVGLFGSVKEAQDYKKDFLEKTKLSSAFVQKVQK
jgi:DedD protein